MTAPAGGRPVQVVARDVAERPQAHSRLRETEERWRAAVENNPECVKLLDRDGRVLEMNLAGLAMIQARLEQVVRGPARNLVAEEDRASFDDMVEAVFRGERRHLVFDMIGLEGRRLTVETSSVPLWDSPARRRVTALLGVTRDITSRLNSELALRESRERLKTAAAEWAATFDALGSAIVLLDGRGCVARLNRAAATLIGAELRACLGLRLRHLAVTARLWRATEEADAIARAQGFADVRRVEAEEGRVYEVEATRLTGPGVRVIATIRDVTALARMQESVRQAQTLAAMGALVAGVAHEVRNPLFAMSVNIDALALELQGRDEFAELVNALRAERDRISRLMEDLLAYGRPAPPETSRGPLDPVLAGALSECTQLADRLGVTIDREGDAAGLEVVMNPERLEGVFKNLLDNACQHSHRGGRVALGVERQGRTARVTVRDSGPGFSADVLPRIFEPFFTRRKGGTGMGLAIVQRIVMEHGGVVCARNAEGGGALVSVDLPLV